MFRSLLNYLKWDAIGKRTIVALGFTVGSWFQHRKLYGGSTAVWLTVVSFIMYTASCLLSGYANQLQNTGTNKKMRLAADLIAIVFMAFGMFGHNVWL